MGGEPGLTPRLSGLGLSRAWPASPAYPRRFSPRALLVGRSLLPATCTSRLKTHAHIVFSPLVPLPPPFPGCAAMEAATALTCTLLPAIEPVTLCTIVPREKHPLGQTVVKANEDRELTGLFTKRYLEEQLLTVLAGRAGEGHVPRRACSMNSGESPGHGSCAGVRRGGRAVPRSPCVAELAGGRVGI